MGDRVKIINSFYDKTGEDSRLLRSRHGQLEYLTTMHYIHKFVPDTARILEVGAGTGRYNKASNSSTLKPVKTWSSKCRTW